jgi:hypothetical protein
LIVAFNDVDENIYHISRCIATCMGFFPDLPILQYVISNSILDPGMIDEFIKIFNPNPKCTWNDGKTALMVAIDAYIQCPNNGRGMKVIDVVLNYDLSYRSLNQITTAKGRNPLHYMVDLGLKWDPLMKTIVGKEYLSLSEPDLDTGLLPFMLAASRGKCDINAIYCLLRTEPSFVS